MRRRSAQRLPAALAAGLLLTLVAACTRDSPDQLLASARDYMAVQYAERAVKRAPDSAPVPDTLGSLLVARGEPPRGVDLLARAARIAPDRPDSRLNYARGLMGAGRKDEARRELEVLASLPKEFADKADIPGLLASL